MLMNAIRKTYQDMVGFGTPVQTVVSVPGVREAANTDIREQSEQQVTRQRRVRRMNRVEQRGSVGWRVSAW